MYVCDLPDDPWVGPATDSAMQPHTLLLPHSVGPWFNHKLRGVHQAVFVYALKVFPVFIDLQTEQYLSIKSLRKIVPLPTIRFQKKKIPIHNAWLRQKPSFYKHKLSKIPTYLYLFYTCMNVTRFMSVCVLFMSYE